MQCRRCRPRPAVRARERIKGQLHRPRAHVQLAAGTQHHGTDPRLGAQTRGAHIQLSRPRPLAPLVRGHVQVANVCLSRRRLPR